MEKSRRRIALIVVAISSRCSAKSIALLPLGDSITFGCGTDGMPGGSADCADDAGGYRVPLLWSLTQAYWPDYSGAHANAQVDVHTVGSRLNGPTTVPQSWRHHEGWPGYRIDQIDDSLERARWTAYNPDIITMHLGTNDCAQDYEPATLDTQMRELLNHTFATLPQTHIFLASILLMQPSQGPGKVCSAGFNELVPAIVDDYSRIGRKITYVPVAEQTGMCAPPGEAGDGLCAGGGVHPISAGYLRMASAFSLSILENFAQNISGVRDGER